MEAEDRPKAPLLWEEKAAIGCLGALAMLELHAGILFFLGKARLGFSEPSWSFGLLLVLYLGLAFGLRRRRPLAWWVAVFAVGGIGLFMMTAVGESVWTTLTFSGRARNESSIPWYLSLRRLDPGEALLLGLSCTLLFAVPLLLLLGAARRAHGQPPS